MSKVKITIIILIAIAVFAGADYYFNNLKLNNSISTTNTSTTNINSNTTTNTNITPNTANNTNTVANNNDTASSNNSIQLNGLISGYKVVSQVQARQIFDKIDLSSIVGIKIYRNILQKANNSSTSAALKSSASPKIPKNNITTDSNQISDQITSSSKVIYLYEIDGPTGQGSITYLKIKNQFTAQIDNSTETINETSSFGDNSFFFNNSNYKNTAFLLVQINDRLFAFQYDKSDVDVYTDVKAIIQVLSSKS